MEIQRFLPVLAVLAAIIGTAAAWRHYGAPSYCAAESRVIPEAEWKVRTLMAIRKAGPQHLTQNMRDLIARQVPQGGSEAAVRAVLADYVRRVPLCCQIDYADSGNFRALAHETGDGPYGLGVKADLVLYEGDETAFFLRDGRQYPPQTAPRVGLHTIAAMHPCGTAVIIWDRG